MLFFSNRLIVEAGELVKILRKPEIGEKGFRAKLREKETRADIKVSGHGGVRAGSS